MFLDYTKLPTDDAWNRNDEAFLCWPECEMLWGVSKRFSKKWSLEVWEDSPKREWMQEAFKHYTSLRNSGYITYNTSCLLF